jgi:hypothetical protein
VAWRFLGSMVWAALPVVTAGAVARQAAVRQAAGVVARQAAGTAARQEVAAL